MEECPPVTVRGDWTPVQSKTLKNKLQLYFQSRKKSGGGDCRVEVQDGGRAAVYFLSEEVRQRVLDRKHHELLLDNQTVPLQLSPAASSSSGDASDSPADSKSQKSQVGPEHESGAEKDDSAFAQSTAVLLENIADDMSRDLLSMLVESVSGLDEDGYRLEVICESNRAVVTFSRPADVQRFITASQTSTKMQRLGLMARPLEVPRSVRVESLPPNVVKDMLELYFEKMWVLPESITMIPEEGAAVVSFTDPKVAESICVKEDHVMRSIPIKVYPYSESLATALYGKERPTWRTPEAFTESVHHAVWKFLLMKNLSKNINDQMRPYFCSVDLEEPEVKLRPVPGFLRQRGLTAAQVNDWPHNVRDAFCQLMSQYSAFECPVTPAAWKAAEKDVRLVVREDAVLVLDASRGMLTVAGRADDIKLIRPPVENLVLQAVTHSERQTNGISEVMSMSPAWFYILKQDGLLKAALDISSEMTLSYDEGPQALTLTGLPAEVYKAKAWILERNANMSKKTLSVPSGLLQFLKTVDSMDMSNDLFTSQGICAIYIIESKEVLLLGTSSRVLADAESKMKEALSFQVLNVEDQEVVKLHSWGDLKQQLLDSYNYPKKTTVTIQENPEDKVTVAGFQNPVKEVSHSLREFIMNYSRFQDSLRVESCAVAQFIDRRRTQDCSRISKDHEVSVHFDSERPRIVLAGARLHVQRAKSCFQDLVSALHTDTLTVDKPGAKKYFQADGSLLLSTILTDFSCVVVLRPEMQEEEEEENFEEERTLCYCKVQTSSGVLISVSKADICSLRVDAVVNAANEDLKHIGGVALALLSAAGPQLQTASNDYVARNGRLSPGEATVTDAFNLPCKYVVHAVGPRFSQFDKMASVSLLKMAVKESLKQAGSVRCSTVALPAISSGVFGFPVDLCADAIAQAVREYCDGPRGPGSLTEIHLVDNNDNTSRVLAAAINTGFFDLGPTMTVPQQDAGRASSGFQGGRGKGRGQSQPSRCQFVKRRGKGGRGAGAHEHQQSIGGGQSPRRNTRHTGPARIEETTAEGLTIVLCQGNIQEQTTDVIVNTIAENMNLDQGAVSKALLEAAGPSLQLAVRSAAGVASLQQGEVVITDGCKLACHKVFHAVCPFWDNGRGQAEKGLMTIIRYCLKEAEKLQMASLSFPAIGTGNLSFPRDVVSRVLLTEVRSFSRRSPRCLREVVIVVHASDSHTVDCFSREFKGQTVPRSSQHEAAGQPPPSQSQRSVAYFGPVLSPSLGVYQMQMGQLTLEVSSGDITKETSDVIVNSSNQDFSLKLGVSKAILDGAGLMVELECAQIVNAPGYQPRAMIMTSGGQLPCRSIIHAVGQKDPAKIKELVYSVLTVCEDNKAPSVSFPALGTGQGGASPSAVANAMVEAVVEFVRKKQPRFTRIVKILIFQTTMMAEFHRSMKSRQGEEVEEKSIFAKFKDSVTSFFEGRMEEQPGADDLVLEREEFEPTVFELCANNNKAVSQAKQRIQDLIVREQAERTIPGPYIGQLSQADIKELNALQGKLTVNIRLDRGQDQEPRIHMEGLTRDVLTAEAAVRDIIHRVERKENLRSKALLLGGLVEWQFEHHGGVMVPFDMYNNLSLEEALEKKQSVKININNQAFIAEPAHKKARSADGRTKVQLLRREVKADDGALPPHWDDMKGAIVKLFTVAPQSQEYNEVEQELTKTGLSVSIISIERVQNTTLWKSYQLLKQQLEAKNQHTHNEKLLFHGTGAKSIDLINNKGFNRSYAGAHGAMYGNGSYFAVDPSYSAQRYATVDQQGRRRMYQARVLVGDYTNGKSGLITPPSKSGVAADLYDSVTDNTANPNMFVVFNDIQAYPEYLITFT
ncbi:protein mono-ADP-ribosyltransferase PARP14-like isoform X3 [Parambassis ranga]|uniref:Poly [ADP-ribose] polymerase n=1 Tax=Parambassis ranga TaxID=210632 RepID=A0A6P7IT86_9TELE|nr:protein mono-ADP-ribosyltransferase PARP14-like isoform X3 [Parambassis ranga]